MMQFPLSWEQNINDPTSVLKTPGKDSAQRKPALCYVTRQHVNFILTHW